jgi:hypothetical protein
MGQAPYFYEENPVFPQQPGLEITIKKQTRQE